MTTTFANAATRTVPVGGSDIAYRQIGAAHGTPVVFLHHLAGVLDEWDPAVVDGIAESHRAIVFDNRGVGRSNGKTPETIAGMAADAIAFMDALKLSQVDLVGFSMGGFLAQVIAQDRADLVRRVILAGTGASGGEGITSIGQVVQEAVQDADASQKHPKHFLFFSQTPGSQQAANAFLQRLNARQEDRGPPISDESFQAHLAAIHHWGRAPDQDRPLSAIRQPVLVANGDNDIMVPTINSIALFHGLPDARLSIFPNAGHGGVFQYHREFVEQALQFLAD